MKVLARVSFAFVVVALMAGCAGNNVVYVPKIPVPVEAKLLDYYKQPGNKVFAVAVDPSGQYAFGYDYGKSTLKEAATVALKKCNASREKYNIAAKAYIYAVNDKVVHENVIRKSFQQTNKSETSE